MKGVQSLASNAGPWPGGPEVAFERTDVTAIGKLRHSGDNRVLLVVRLTHGNEVFVNASKQSPEDGSWLYKTGLGLLAGLEVICWKELV